jgi:hypothetical protein
VNEELEWPEAVNAVGAVTIAIMVMIFI